MGERPTNGTKAEHLRLSGFHALLRLEPEREVHRRTENEPEEVSEEMRGAEQLAPGNSEHETG